MKISNSVIENESRGEKEGVVVIRVFNFMKSIHAQKGYDT